MSTPARNTLQVFTCSPQRADTTALRRGDNVTNEALPRHHKVEIEMEPSLAPLGARCFYLDPTASSTAPSSLTAQPLSQLHPISRRHDRTIAIDRFIMS
ncbi:hypothetical protein RB195_009707 [Necator americanus]|uniref:Uncharacterized protein n=1 Tax=Necator americanus TaxID=51031 RepID=A0ABR1CV32_NECAM